MCTIRGVHPGALRAVLVKECAIPGFGQPSYGVPCNAYEALVHDTQTKGNKKIRFAGSGQLCGVMNEILG